MKPENVTCPECDGPMVSRTSTHGRFWGCKDYPRCKGTRNVDGEANRSRADEDADMLPSDRLRNNDRRRW
jgi:ssDNA-binding Zn-finger/Zn-ribbon topoisomerase 1